MKNRELFDRANSEDSPSLKAKLRNDFAEWCKENGRTQLNTQSTIDWWDEDVKWQSKD